MDWVYLAFPVPAGLLGPALEGMRALGVEGLSVTMPHKAAAAAAVDRLSATAARLGAANTVTRQGTVLVGDNTDGAGFLDALRAAPGIEPAGRRCLVVGAGGGARAVVLALADAGAAEVVVVNRSRANAEAAARLAGPRGRVGVAEDAGRAEVVVNATPLGMGTPGPAGERLPVDPERLGAGQVVIDLVYHPVETPLLAAARARGATVANGAGMLVHQAGHQFRLWTGLDPPLDAMSAAVGPALSGEGGGH